MFCHVEGVKGSQTGHKGRRVGPQEVDDPCLDGTGGEKHVTLWEGAGLGKKSSPVSHEGLQSSSPSRDQVRIHWLLTAPIMPSGFHGLKSHQTEDQVVVVTVFREEADCGLRHVPQWVP